MSIMTVVSEPDPPPKKKKTKKLWATVGELIMRDIASSLVYVHRGNLFFLYASLHSKIIEAQRFTHTIMYAYHDYSL